MKRQISQLQEEVVSYRKEATSHRKETTSLRKETASLREEKRSISNLFQDANLRQRQLRTRFILFFKRDSLREKLTTTEQELVKEGNLVAHGGNALQDAKLYDPKLPKPRQDSIFKTLYGLDPDLIQTIGKLAAYNQF
jgi:chromosome segregation ATPase